MNIKIILLAAVILGAAAAGFSQDTITQLHDSSFKTHMRPAAKFLHDAHNEKAGVSECNACHHVYKNGIKQEGESSEDRKCADCHFKNESTMELATAFHQRCKGCHQEQNKGPILCAECHEK